MAADSKSNGTSQDNQVVRKAKAINGCWDWETFRGLTIEETAIEVYQLERFIRPQVIEVIDESNPTRVYPVEVSQKLVYETKLRGLETNKV